MTKPKNSPRKTRKAPPEKELTEEEIRDVELRIAEVRASPAFLARIEQLEKKRQKPCEIKAYSCHYNNSNHDPIFEGRD